MIRSRLNRSHTAQLAASFLVVAVLATIAAPLAAETDQYGEPVSDATTIRISDLLADPERYIDQKVKVEGLVEDICPMKGCWIDILDRQSKETVRFKVEDDVIVFPAEAKGSQVVAEGIMRKHEMSKEQAINWLRHLAEEKGETFDDSTVTGPMDFYQIEGLGAQVQAP